MKASTQESDTGTFKVLGQARLQIASLSETNKQNTHTHTEYKSEQAMFL